MADNTMHVGVRVASIESSEEELAGTIVAISSAGVYIHTDGSPATDSFKAEWDAFAAVEHGGWLKIVATPAVMPDPVDIPRPPTGITSTQAMANVQIVKDTETHSYPDAYLVGWYRAAVMILGDDVRRLAEELQAERPNRFIVDQIVTSMQRTVTRTLKIEA